MQLLQALGYTSIISKWPAEKFAEKYSENATTNVDPREQLEQFLDSQDTSTLNQSRRIILLAEDFDHEVLLTAEWLTEKFEVDVRCYRLALSSEAENEFLTCTHIYLFPEITEHVIRRKGVVSSGPLWLNWEMALRKTENGAVTDFFRRQLSAKRENNLKYRRLLWRFNGKRRFRVMEGRAYAIVRQCGRFQDDVTFWTDKMGTDIRLREPDQARNCVSCSRQKNNFRRSPKLSRTSGTRLSFKPP